MQASTGKQETIHKQSYTHIKGILTRPKLPSFTLFTFEQSTGSQNFKEYTPYSIFDS